MPETLDHLRNAGVHPVVVRDGTASSVNPDTAVKVVNLLLTRFGVNAKLIDSIINLINTFHPHHLPDRALALPSSEDALEHLRLAGVDNDVLDKMVAEPEHALSPAVVVGWLQTLLGAAAKYGPGIFDAVTAFIEATKENEPEAAPVTEPVTETISGGDGEENYEPKQGRRRHR